MDDEDVDELIVSVRADTRAFASDVKAMRSAFDTNLVDGFTKAGSVLEHGLLSAIRKGSLGFEDLKRTALAALDQIAAQALRTGLDTIFAGGGNGGIAAALGGTFAPLLGLPGRATGGLVSPDRPYIVGERGPELFVPDNAGRIEPGAGSHRRSDVRVAISVNAPRGASVPVAMQRSSRQMASAVCRAISS